MGSGIIGYFFSISRYISLLAALNRMLSLNATVVKTASPTEPIWKVSEILYPLLPGTHTSAMYGGPFLL